MRLVAKLAYCPPPRVAKSGDLVFGPVRLSVRPSVLLLRITIDASFFIFFFGDLAFMYGWWMSLRYSTLGAIGSKMADWQPFWMPKSHFFIYPAQNFCTHKICGADLWHRCVRLWCLETHQKTSSPDSKWPNGGHFCSLANQQNVPRINIFFAILPKPYIVGL